MKNQKEMSEIVRCLQKTVDFVRETSEDQRMINADLAKSIKRLQDEITIIKGQQHVMDVVSGLARRSSDWG